MPTEMFEQTQVPRMSPSSGAIYTSNLYSVGHEKRHSAFLETMKNGDKFVLRINVMFEI